ncbi:MAG: GMC family oxidoreductase [Sinimarinibacterium flocculans]|uniref:GMC family oxidoreductase n=1 Tax=Sinimarinibacterium flocculans TaxID=985250 RepID=UPI003C3CA3A8
MESAVVSARYDFIVIGGGSSGCIAAARLAERGFRVLLLEAGEEARANPYTLSADGFKDAFASDATMWHRMSAPQAQCGDRALYAGTGRGLGGSGGVNGMVYTRGDRRDFAQWPAGWQWEDLEPAFSAVERKLGVRPRPPTPFAQRFLDSCVQAGFERKDGMNDGDLAGVAGCNDMNYSGEERRSSYRAWLHDSTPRQLTVACRAMAQRIVFDARSRAVAVEYLRDGQRQRVAVNREVVLCAGALETPKLLMLSGVGPRADLEALGIACVLDAPGVGRHLQDHPNVPLFYRARVPVDFKYPQVYAFDAARRDPGAPRNEAPPDTCYVCYAAPASIKHSMLRMLPVLALPGRLHSIGALRSLLRGLVHLAFALPPLKRFVRNLFGIVVILGKPRSRGSVRLQSADPSVPARIDLGYFRDAADRDVMEAAIDKARRIAAQAPLVDAGSRTLSAGGRPIDRDKLWKWIHAGAMTTFHFCGTCRMGEDSESPVDPQLRVKGLSNVRVADASVFPEIPVSALNAPSMMVGYRVADFIGAMQPEAGTAPSRMEVAV